MNAEPKVIVAAYDLWVVFLVTWWLAAVWTSRAAARGELRHQIGYFLGFAIGFGFLFTTPAAPLDHQHILYGFAGLLPSRWRRPLWAEPVWLEALLFAAELAAFAFGWWSRVHLGKLWSGMLTLREGHRIVDTGPYGVVRHPIYTAFIAASWALALIIAAPATLLGAVVLTIVMTVKAGTEERLLERYFGLASYAAYRQRVPKLIPFGPR